MLTYGGYHVTASFSHIVIGVSNVEQYECVNSGPAGKDTKYVRQYMTLEHVKTLSYMPLFYMIFCAK